MKTKRTFWYTTSESYKGIRNEVPENFKRDFAEKQITCGWSHCLHNKFALAYIFSVEYVGLTPGYEREIFQRVQLGMTLTAAGKLCWKLFLLDLFMISIQKNCRPFPLHGLSKSETFCYLSLCLTTMARWITQLEARHVSVDGGLSDVLEWDTKRGRDFQNIAHMVFCCDGLPDELLPTAQKIEKWISRVDNPPEQFKIDIEEVLTAFWRIASNKKYNEAFTKISQRIAPVEFIFIGKR